LALPLSLQQAEQAKAARKPVIHLLAVEPMTEKALRKKVPDTLRSHLKEVLQKVGDWNESIGRGYNRFTPNSTKWARFCDHNNFLTTTPIIKLFLIKI